MNEKFLEFLREMRSVSSGFSEDGYFLKIIGDKLRKVFGADDVIVKDVYKNSKDRTQTEDFLINTGKPYIDNRLSGYSAFGELIKYNNMGFKSCMMLPIKTQARQFGIITFLSKNENHFDEKNIEMFGFVADGVALEYNAIVDKEKNLTLAKYFDAAFDSIFPQAIVDKNGTIIKANKNLLNLINKNISEMGMLQITPFFNFEQKPDYINKTQIIKTRRIGENKVFTTYFKRINENLYHLLFYEITNLEMEQLKDMLVETNYVQLFLLIDNDAKIYWTSGFELFKSFSNEEIIGKNLFNMIKERDLQKNIDAVVTDKKSIDLTVKLLNDATIDVKASITKNDRGYGVVLWKNNDKYINKIEKTLNDLIKFSDEMIITVDTMGYVREINEGFEKTLGYTSSNISGLSISSICADQESQMKISNALNIVKKGGMVNGMEISVISKNSAEPIPSSQTVKANYDNDGKLNGYMFIGKELATRRKLLKKEVELMDLERENVKLEGESQLKTQFIYNISHDLKTPITNIMGFSKLMLGGEFGTLNEEQQRNLNIIISEGDRLLQLIAQILDVAKLEAKKIKLDIKFVNLNTIKESPVISSLGEVALNKNITFSFDVDFDVPEVEADPNRLIQVFVNLIGNAIKFTDKGGISVSIKRYGKKNDPRVRVEINDTGVGISKEYKNKLFKKFYQVKRETLTRQEGTGTGLGLSIAKEIVSLHGGKIGFTSKPGLGSTFWFWLPVSQKQKKKNKEEEQ